jgi:RNA polymerase sigma-70 factor (ECF subfamily)
LSQDGKSPDERAADKLEDDAPSESARLSESTQRDAFARLFAQHDRWLFSYLVTLLANSAHAEEVFQEVCVVLWREHEKFQLGTNFVKWASVIAHHQVQKFRRERKRLGPQLSDKAVEQLATTAAERADLFDFRRDALRRCLGKLSDEDRLLVQTCYADSSDTFKAAAQRMGRSVNTVYKALNRIRRVLHECIDRKLTAEGML